MIDREISFESKMDYASYGCISIDVVYACTFPSQIMNHIIAVLSPVLNRCFKLLA